MYHFQNPANDFYQGQNYGQQLQQFPPQTPRVICRFVTNIEEAKAAMVDPMSMSLFLDTGNGCIYLKKLANNGCSEFLTYTIGNTAEQKKSDPVEEIKSRLTNIERCLGDIRNAKSIPDNEQSAGVPQQPASGAYASDDGAESGGLQKNAGNDKWKKRQ